MSIRTVVTRGYDSYGTIPLVVIRGYGAEPVAQGSDTAGDVATQEEIRRLERAMLDASKARESSRRAQRRKEQRLAKLIERTYRKLVEQEPEVAAEIVAKVEPQAETAWSPDALRAAIVANEQAVTTLASAITDWFWQRQAEREEAERARAARLRADEEDTETVLLLTN